MVCQSSRCAFLYLAVFFQIAVKQFQTYLCFFPFRIHRLYREYFSTDEWEAFRKKENERREQIKKERPSSTPAPRGQTGQLYGLPVFPLCVSLPCSLFPDSCQAVVELMVYREMPQEYEKFLYNFLLMYGVRKSFPEDSVSLFHFIKEDVGESERNVKCFPKKINFMTC